MRVKEQAAPPREGGVGGLGVKNCFLSLSLPSLLSLVVYFLLFFKFSQVFALLFRINDKMNNMACALGAIVVHYPQEQK